MTTVSEQLQNRITVSEKVVASAYACPPNCRNARRLGGRGRGRSDTRDIASIRSGDLGNGQWSRAKRIAWAASIKRDIKNLGLTETHEIIPDASSGTPSTPSKEQIGTPIDRFILQTSIHPIPNCRSTVSGAV